MSEPRESRWLLLIHQIPPKPDYFRVKIWRRLLRLGAVAVKNSVYVLPKSDQAQEDFQWVVREIIKGKGDATLCEARFIEGLSDQQVEELFQSARSADYHQISDAARQLERSLGGKGKVRQARREAAITEWRRLKRRLTEVVTIDFFGAQGREATEGLLSALEKNLELSPGITERAVPAKFRLEDLRGRTWVTRKGIYVDRMASAWLVRRFIDPDVSFKFVPANGYKPESDEIRFDMFEAEFTHEGDRCTMEVLIDRMGIRDAALRIIAEIVHDIDIKDAKFDHLETAGIEHLVAGIAMSHKDDETRLERSAAVFDDLYEYFRRRRQS
jgi:hypothetical protein